MLTREEIFVIYESGPEAVISVIQRLENIIEEEQGIEVKRYPIQIKWKPLHFQCNELFSLIS